MRVRALFALPVLLLPLLAPKPTAPPAPSAAPVSEITYTGPTTDERAVLERAVRAALITQWEQDAATPAPKNPRPKPTPVAYNAGDGSVWDRIAACESGGDWADNTGNGYYGGLQENLAFWRSYGGDEFAARPDLASREQQIIVAERARDSGRGYGPWPVCERRA